MSSKMEIQRGGNRESLVYLNYSKIAPCFGGLEYSL